MKSREIIKILGILAGVALAALTVACLGRKRHRDSGARQSVRGFAVITATLFLRVVFALLVHKSRKSRYPCSSDVPTR